MAPGELLFSVLSQAPAVGALVGTRIYPLRIPEGQPRPAITYQLISRVPQGRPMCDLADAARVQLSLFTDTYAQQEALAAACRQALHGYALGPVYAELSNEIDHYDEGALCYFKTQDYELELPAA